MPPSKNKSITYLFFAIILTALIFFVDINIPLGVAFGVPYIIVILITLLTSNRQTVLLFSIICTLLTLAGLIYSPYEGEIWKIYFNRTIAIFAIWVTTLLGLMGKHAQEKLRKNEARLLNAQRISQLGFWDWKIDKNQLYWSDEIYKIFGLSVQEMGGNYENFINSVHPNDREYLQNTVNSSILNNEPYSIDHRIILPNGEIRYVHEDGEVKHNNNGTVIGMFGTVKDITDRIHSEVALRNSEQQLSHINEILQNVIEEIPLSVFWKNDESRYLGCNSRFAKDIGFISDEQIIGKNDFDLFPKILAEKCRKEDLYLMKSHKSKLNATKILYPDDGKKRKYLRVSMVPLILPEGSLFGVLGCYEDITERVEAEEEIQSWKYRYDSAIKASRNILYDWDSKTNNVIYGGDIKNILGYPIDQLSGNILKWTELIHPEDLSLFNNSIERAIKYSEPTHLQYRVKKNDGSYIHVEDSGQFTKKNKEGNTTRMIGFVKDITKEIKTRELLKETEKIAAIGRMAARIAHEINNPLAGIKNSLQLIEQLSSQCFCRRPAY